MLKMHDWDAIDNRTGELIARLPAPDRRTAEHEARRIVTRLLKFTDRPYRVARTK